jgi:hypothetical protein
VWVQGSAAVEKGEFDQDGYANKVCAELVDESDGCRSGAAGGQEIIHNENGFAGEDGVLMKLDVGFAVFERVCGLACKPWEFSFFPDGNEPGTETVGYGGGEDKSPGVDADYLVHMKSTMGFAKQGDGFPEEFAVGKDGGDVFEDDAGFGEVGDITDGGSNAGGGVHGGVMLDRVI